MCVCVRVCARAPQLLHSGMPVLFPTWRTRLGASTIRHPLTRPIHCQLHGTTSTNSMFAFFLESACLAPYSSSTPLDCAEARCANRGTVTKYCFGKQGIRRYAAAP